MISLSDAADAAKVSKSTLLRAIKKGKVSASRNEAGAFEIDPAELARVYPATSHDASSLRQMERHDAAKDATDALVAQLRQTIDDLRSDRDAWREQAQRLALPQPETSRPWWKRLAG